MTDLLNHETWQHLLGLESVDVVCEWHQKICNLELNTRRAVEITSSAKQAREYFRNAANSANAVRPLLTFYGVASLARSTLLLLKPRNGEESITKGHGLETVDWSRTLSGDLSTALKAMGELKIRSCSGLFNDFLTQTNNRICMHIRSAAVDWRLTYQLPSLGEELTLAALLSTIPDLEKVVPESGHNPSYASVNELTYSHAEGFVAKVDSKKSELSGTRTPILDMNSRRTAGCYASRVITTPLRTRPRSSCTLMSTKCLMPFRLCTSSSRFETI